MRHFGINDNFWSSIATTTLPYAYYLRLYDFLNPSYQDHRWIGFSVQQFTLSSPFYFSRGGVTDLITGSHRYIGYGGYYRSSLTSINSSIAQYLYFGSDVTFPSYSNYRWYGFSVQKSILLDSSSNHI